MKHFPGFVSLIILIAGCTDNTSTATNESAGQPQTASIATPVVKLVYEQKCATCHGSDGTAGIAGATNLQQSRSDSLSVIRIISNGKNAMPSFKSLLSEEEIHKLVSY